MPYLRGPAGPGCNKGGKGLLKLRGGGAWGKDFKKMSKKANKRETQNIFFAVEPLRERGEGVKPPVPLRRRKIANFLVVEPLREGERSKTPCTIKKKKKF